MARRKVAYRKRHQNRLSMVLVTLVVLMITAVVLIHSVELQKKLDSYTAKEETLLDQKAEQEARTLSIEEYRIYTQTKRYVEEVAKDKLGLVYEGEILFKEEN